ncbi:MFS transporter [Sulfuriferula nivalis]|uniref:MFS transporter n=1 Tax=Sulfuriferula nivalis TaxID=2675298 RepID=A0A809SCH7_9PROT|nr:MFS transporter [Sulfuriferula nivalis]BBO99896.1 MFS transporter [Sulfuriferula nivalis]
MNKTDVDIDKMNASEVRASVGLASIFGLRMLGMFLILPVFALYAEHLPGGSDHTMVGLALGAYGLTQAMLQLPFGMASDHFGRKRVIYIGLILFAIGSFVAANATTIETIIIGRIIQGAGAISAAVTALLADSTREEHRTHAMAMIGGTIGVTFAVSLVLGPALYQYIGMHGIFLLTAVLSLTAIAVVKWYIPDPAHSQFHLDAEASPGKLREVLRNTQLLRLNFGIFALHAAQMAMFVVIPFALRSTGNLDINHHWEVYLPVVLVAFIVMVPAIIYGEKKAKLKQVFVAAVALMLMAQLGMAASMQHFWGIVGALLAYFIAFNVLEATLPSLISKIAPVGSKGTAIGVYNTSQSIGLFVGGVVGGWLSQHYGYAAVFMFSAGLMVLWLIAAVGMRTPPAVKTRMFRLGVLTPHQADILNQKLREIQGVHESTVIAQESIAIMKVAQRGWDEASATKLIEESKNGVSK